MTSYPGSSHLSCCPHYVVSRHHNHSLIHSTPSLTHPLTHRPPPHSSPRAWSLKRPQSETWVGRRAALHSTATTIALWTTCHRDQPSRKHTTGPSKHSPHHSARYRQTHLRWLVIPALRLLVLWVVNLRPLIPVLRLLGVWVLHGLRAVPAVATAPLTHCDIMARFTKCDVGLKHSSTSRDVTTGLHLVHYQPTSHLSQTQ
jgi:hypothetical protein